MTNQERAQKLKEVELTTLQKISTLEARLTTLSAQPVSIYWRENKFAFSSTSAYPYSCGYVTEIRNTAVHFTNGESKLSIPLTWLSEGVLQQLWGAYVDECKEHLPKERFDEVMKGLE